MTATMLRIDTVRPSDNGLVKVEVVVCFSGPELPFPDVHMVDFDIDLTQTPNQIQTALAAGIRASVPYSLPSNAINVFAFAKG